VDGAARAVAHLDPRAVLTRGYAIVTTSMGDIVYDAAQLANRDAVRLAFARGAARATITDVEPHD
jgi:exodeoxyribonuclease VII large subunit